MSLFEQQIWTRLLLIPGSTLHHEIRTKGWLALYYASLFERQIRSTFLHVSKVLWAVFLTFSLVSFYKHISSSEAPGFNAKIVDENSKASFLLPTVTAAVPNKIPKDSFHLAYIFYFTLGLDYLLPWNAFITAVDYFAHLYPYASVDRIFSIVYIVVSLFCLLLIIFYSHKSEAYVRINVGLSFFVVSLIAVPHGCVLHQGSG
ncbi:hypothetical protein EV2_036109 [Malus domestica]